MTTIVQSLSDMVSPKPTALIPVVSLNSLPPSSSLNMALTPRSPCLYQADGSEEIEVVTLSEVLARAGVRVTIAAVSEDRANRIVTLMQGTMIQADKSIEHCVNDEFDLIVVPGGSGAKVLGACATLADLLRKQKTSGKLYGGICAGPVDVLYHHALVNGPMTCLLDYKDPLGDLFVDEEVVVTGNCVTSQSPGTALAMALKLVELLRGEKTAQDLAKSLSVCQ